MSVIFLYFTDILAVILTFFKNFGSLFNICKHFVCVCLLSCYALIIIIKKNNFMQKDLNDGQKIVLSAIAGAFVLLVIESIFGDSKDNKNITKALITGAATGAIIGGLKVLAEKNDKKKQKDDLKESETEQKNSPQQETSKQNSTIRQNSAGYGL